MISGIFRNSWSQEYCVTRLTNGKLILNWGSLLRKKSKLYTEGVHLGNTSFSIGYGPWNYYKPYPSRQQKRGIIVFKYNKCPSSLSKLFGELLTILFCIYTTLETHISVECPNLYASKISKEIRGLKTSKEKVNSVWLGLHHVISFLTNTHFRVYPSPASSGAHLLRTRAFPPASVSKSTLIAHFANPMDKFFSSRKTEHINLPLLFSESFGIIGTK